MGETVRISVDEELEKALQDWTVKISKSIEKAFKIKDVTLHGTLSSRAFAAWYWSQKLGESREVHFTISKNGPMKGVIQFL